MEPDKIVHSHRKMTELPETFKITAQRNMTKRKPILEKKSNKFETYLFLPEGKDDREKVDYVQKDIKLV